MENNNILGFIKIDANNIDLYLYESEVMSGANLVYENNKWVYVCNSSKSKLVNNCEKYLYQIVTNDRNVYLDNNRFKDFICIHDHYVITLSDCITEYILNN